MTCREGQFYVVESRRCKMCKLEAFSIDLNAQHVNGMTPYDLFVHSGKYGYLIVDNNKSVF